VWFFLGLSSNLREEWLDYALLLRFSPLFIPINKHTPLYCQVHMATRLVVFHVDSVVIVYVCNCVRPRVCRIWALSRGDCSRVSYVHFSVAVQVATQQASVLIAPVSPRSEISLRHVLKRFAIIGAPVLGSDYVLLAGHPVLYDRPSFNWTEKLHN